jgi:hypothetical protein
MDDETSDGGPHTARKAQKVRFGFSRDEIVTVVSSPASMSESTQVLVQRGAQQFGPFTVSDVIAHHATRRLLSGDLAWHQGMAGWEPLGTVMNRLGHPLPLQSDANGVNTWLVPVGRSGWAIAAGYLALFSVLFVFAPFALVCGIMGLRSIEKNPGLGGKGRAWFGIIMGGLVSALVVIGLCISFFQS